MKIKYTLIFLLIITSTVLAQKSAPLGKFLSNKFISMADDETALIIIYLKDKGNSSTLRNINPQNILSEKAIQRRLKVRTVANLIDYADLPLDQSYVNQIYQNVKTVRHQLKWFNAISAIATKMQIEVVRKFPFVREIELVGRWRRDDIEVQFENEEKSDHTLKPSKVTPLDYGTSYKQVDQINVPAVHKLGFWGQGVMIGVFDNGFRLPNHEAFDSMTIVATYDFVDNKVSVIPNNPATNFGGHGVMTLSTIGGYKPGQLIGPAFKSSYVLARTENDSSETPIEEDNWAKALEWADSIGVDVTSTSLGYLTYDPPYPSWTWEDMDGNTTLITRAADRAVSLGIVVVNSAGNSGYHPDHNTINAPADGDSVIAVGAVDSFGVRTSFSSVGPTSDGRIKPDVMAMGKAVKAASPTITNSYIRVQGTSFSCPLTAGVAALILCANPTWTPIQVRDALRQTANNASNPNNLYGWGIINALDAILQRSFTVESGWNLLSLPHRLADRRISFVYPASISEAFGYDKGYISCEMLPQNKGYWIKYQYSQTVFLNGSARIQDTIKIDKGWQIIGSLSFPIAVKNIQKDPPEMVISDFYGWSGKYIRSDTLYPHKGYWIKAKSSGTLILDLLR